MAQSLRVTADFRTRIICEARLSAGNGLFSISDTTQAPSADAVVICLTPAKGYANRSTAELGQTANGTR